MRLTIKVLLVGVGVALLIAGLPSPRGTATSGGSDPTGVVSIVTGAQPADPDQPDTDDEQGAAEQEGRDDTPVSGTAAERAKAAAQDAVPGATVRQVERETNDDDTPSSAFEVELVRPDGTTVEVELDADYKVVSTDRENDRRDDD
jgi:uncharacterized membrane protein YkoI